MKSRMKNIGKTFTTAAFLPLALAAPLSAAAEAAESAEAQVRAGVPTAPKGTGIVLQMRATATADVAGKPRPTSSGAASAAAAPKPAAPSMKPLNSQAMTTTWTRRSRDRQENEPLSAVRAPLARRMFSSRMAPKMMRMMSSDLRAPWSIAAAASSGVMCHTVQPRMAVRPMADSSAQDGRTLNWLIRIRATAIGSSARRQSMVAKRGMGEGERRKKKRK